MNDPTPLAMYPKHIRAIRTGEKTTTIRARRMEGIFYSFNMDDDPTIKYKLKPLIQVDWPTCNQVDIAKSEGGYTVVEFLKAAKAVWPWQFNKFVTGEWQPWLHEIVLLEA